MSKFVTKLLLGVCVTLIGFILGTVLFPVIFLGIVELESDSANTSLRQPRADEFKVEDRWWFYRVAGNTKTTVSTLSWGGSTTKTTITIVVEDVDSELANVSTTTEMTQAPDVGQNYVTEENSVVEFLDRSQIAEDWQLPMEEYLLKAGYRIVGQETVRVGAGVFHCDVYERQRTYGTQRKFVSRKFQDLCVLTIASSSETTTRVELLTLQIAE